MRQKTTPLKCNIYGGKSLSGWATPRLMPHMIDSLEGNILERTPMMTNALADALKG